MSYNGSGTFNINSAGQPVVSGTVISSTAFNALTSDLATGLTTALTKDGQTTPTANISLGSYKITNLAAGTAAADAVRFDQLTSAGVPLITVAGTADAITGTITPSLTAYTTGGVFSFVVGSTNTTAVTLNIDGLGVKSVTRTGSVALVAGDMVTGQVVLVEYDGTRFQLLNGNSFTNLKASGTLGVTGLTTLGVTGAVFPGSTSGTATIVAPAVAGTPTLTLPITSGTFALTSQVYVVRSYLAGLTLSTAGSSATMSIAAGTCADSTNTAMMTLAATSKTTSSWALGSATGGLDTGTIANSTWYHFYVIQRVDTSVVDVVFSTNATTPTLPTNYTLYRRIGCGLTNGSAQWTAFIQFGDYFRWSTGAQDVSTTVNSSSAVSKTITTPLGVNVIAFGNIFWNPVTNSGAFLISDLDAADEAVADAPNFPTGSILVTAGNFVGGYWQCKTNTSSQIRTRASNANANAVKMTTDGWYDYRGRNA